jgi:hypothetical protein
MLEQSRAGIGGSDVVVLVELSAGTTLCEVSDVTCTFLEAVGGHDAVFQRLVVRVFPLSVDVLVVASCTTVGGASLPLRTYSNHRSTDFLKMYVQPQNCRRLKGDVKPSSFPRPHNN